MTLPGWLTLTRVIVATALLAFLIAFLSMRGCKDSRQEAQQAQQDTRSADAYAGAAKGAVLTVVKRSEEEVALKEVVNEAAKDIANAEGSEQAIPPAARAAALRAACRLPDYRDEPACQVQPTRP